MIFRLLAAVVASLPLLASAGGALVHLPIPAAAELKAQAADSRGRLRIGTVRGLAKSARAEGWTRVDGGFVAEFSATSEAAMGIRARLDLGAFDGPLEVRAQAPGGAIETLSVDPRNVREAWTPWTEG